MTAPLPAWAELVSDFVEVFGKGVSVNNLRLTSVPGYQLGMSFEEHVAQVGGYVLAYEQGMGGFGPQVEPTKPTLQHGWKRYGDVPRGTRDNSTQQSTLGI